MTTRTRLAVILALVTVGVAGGALAFLGDGSEPGPRPTPTTTATAAPSPTSTASPTEAATESLEEQLVRVAAVVEQVRELTFDDRPEPTILGAEELAERVAEQVSEYTVEDAELDGRLLGLLGAVPRDADLRELLVTAYSEQVAGYYDDETGELVVGATTGGARLSPLNEVILAHELQHALADQALGLPDVDGLGEGREDEALARVSLVEGDATVSMQRYAQVGLSMVDQLRIAQEAADLQAGLADLTELPPYLQGSIEFPYVYGAEFVADLLATGGWAAVDRAYASPPVSTAQILFPERYRAGQGPRTPPATGHPGGAWEAARTYAFGAADLLLLFGAPGGEPGRALDEPRGAVAGWEGGAARLFTDGGASAAALALAGAQLCDPIDAWYAASFPDATRSQAEGAVVFEHDAQVAVLRCDGDGVRLGVGPDRNVATALVAG